MHTQILRAGLTMAEATTYLLPDCTTYHFGVARNEETLKPQLYYCKMPAKMPQAKSLYVRLTSDDPNLLSRLVR